MIIYNRYSILNLESFTQGQTPPNINNVPNPNTAKGYSKPDNAYKHNNVCTAVSTATVQKTAVL